MSTLCLVFCDTDKHIAYERCEQMQGSGKSDQIEEEKKGEEKGDSNVFPLQMFEDYASRMEYPNDQKRWDQPLFRLQDEQELPLEEIFEAISDKSKNKPKDPISTKPEMNFDENFI